MESNNGKITIEQVENSFGGNLCRCTGYRSILDAFKSLATNGSGCDIEDLPLNICRKCDKGCDIKTNISLEDNGKMWVRPANLPELLTILTKHSMDLEYMLVAGNTAHGIYCSIFCGDRTIFFLNSNLTISGVYRRSEKITVFIINC